MAASSERRDEAPGNVSRRGAVRPLPRLPSAGGDTSAAPLSTVGGAADASAAASGRRAPWRGVVAVVTGVTGTEG